MSFPLGRCTIFLTLAGSRAHGTARDDSDVDVRGVCIAPLSVRLGLFTAFEQHEGPLDASLAAAVDSHLKTTQALETESVVFDVAKFLALCAEANPNTLEILFADERDWVVATPAFRRLHDARHEFLTKQVQATFQGYALAQLKKIKTHRSWLLEPPARKPTREDFGLPAASGTLSPDDQNRIEQSVAEKLRHYGVDDIEMSKPARLVVEERMRNFATDLLAVSEDEVVARTRAVASHALNLPPEVVGSLNAERKYRAALKHWESYETWKARRNPLRAELERTHGYDTKHAMHLIRLMRMGIEALESGELFVRRSDAAELIAIREGAWSFDELMTSAIALQAKMERAATETKLRDRVDRDRVNGLAFELITTAG